MLLYAITGFLSAFLLFQVQPVIAKVILPWFGGSSSVWTTCMLFFQVALLGGYLYAHWLNRKLTPRMQAWVHCAALGASLLTLPILPDAGWKPAGPEHPSPRILGLLAASVGLPYFLLAATSPLLQAWYARRHTGASPYRLYALSNLGSLLALLSYPVLVEPLFSTKFQGLWWSAAYAGFAVLCGWTAWRPGGARAHELQAAAEEGKVPAPTWRERAVWLSLAGCASVLLLSVTTFLTQDVASIPFLWILPLAVYLLSFILCFDAPRYYRRGVFLPLLAVSLAGMCLLMKDAVQSKWLLAVVASVAAALFVCCMVCHGELVRRKPHPRHLTDFYVMVSVGGAAGGLFVGVLAPAAFNAYYELPLGLAGCAVLAVGMLLSDHGGWFRKGRRWIWRIPLAASLAIYLGAVGWVVRESVSGFRLMDRNFYGQLRVQDYRPLRQDPYRILVHGLINHGHQFLAGPYRNQPVSYFCPGTGIGDAMQIRREGTPMRVGILGLGIGTLVAYGREGDTFRLYEINPLVRDIAQQEFHYLRDSKAKVEIVMGDGRLSLEGEPKQQFDLLVMDAFSGDSVPVHLVTREAFGTYFRHLRPGGILAVNTSNRHLDLKPVMERNATSFGKTALQFEFDVYDEDDDDDGGCLDASWTLIVDPGLQDSAPRLFMSGRRIPPRPEFRMWTDEFSNLYGILK